jgi:OOP family OmpA-OmpF porin
MAMKYIKLFESWRLMEAEGKQDAFDVNKPDGWPVLQTTIGDLRKAFSSGEKKLNELLYSVFRRALQTGKNWDKDAGKDKSIINEVKYVVEPPTGRFPLGYYLKEILTEMKYDVEDDAKGEGLYKNLYKIIVNQPGFEEMFNKKNFVVLKKLEKQKKTFENWIKNDWKEIPNLNDKLTFGVKGNYDFTSTATKVVKRLPAYFDKTIEKISGRNEQYYILISSVKTETDEDGVITEIKGDVGMKIRIPSIKDNSLNPDDAPIYDFQCEEIVMLQANGKNVNISKPDDVNLSLGMPMTWYSNYAKTGNNQTALLSSTGAKNYQTDIASIFAGEDAEELTQFAQTVKVGGQNLALANGVDGTKVPIFVSTTVQGVCAFDFNKSTLQDSGKKSLEAKALWGLLSKAAKSIEIIGHTDSVGKADYNKKLSEQRAQSVLEHLKTLPEFKQLKVQPTTTGKGSTEPIKDDSKGKDTVAAALNRRVVIAIDGVQPDYAKLGIK